MLEHQSCRDAAAPEPPLTIESFRAWLDDFTVYSDRIPAIPGETFSRESICQDHD